MFPLRSSFLPIRTATYISYIKKNCHLTPQVWSFLILVLISEVYALIITNIYKVESIQLMIFIVFKVALTVRKTLQ